MPTSLGNSKYSDAQRDAAFWRKVDPCRTDGCMVWVGSHNDRGYGLFWDGSKLKYAHHYLVGPPPAGLEWDHVKAWGCTNIDCVNPGHLEAVTHRENVRRGRMVEAQRERWLKYHAAKSLISG